VFLPVSIPMVRATAVSALLGMACPPRALQSPQPTLRVVGGRSTAGPSHSRRSTERPRNRAWTARHGCAAQKMRKLVPV